MTYDQVLELSRRKGLGENLTPEECALIESYTAKHPERASDIEFEQVLAATMIESPAVAAPENFTNRLMAALPPRMAFTPQPWYAGMMNWIIGGSVAGAVTSAMAWNWRIVWLGWIDKLLPESGVNTVAATSSSDLPGFLNLVLTQFPDVASPVTVLAIVAALGAFAWSAVAFAEEAT